MICRRERLGVSPDLREEMGWEANLAVMRGRRESKRVWMVKRMIGTVMIGQKRISSS